MEKDKNNKKNEDKKTKKELNDEKLDEAIEQAKKDMDELMKSIQDEVGMKNVRVVQVQIPKSNFKNFITGLIISLFLNTLLIVGMSGFYEYLQWDKIYDLIFFAIYFTFAERIIDFIFIKYFTPLIIRTMGLASIIPDIISLALVIIFPIFVNIENVIVTVFTLVVILVFKTILMSFIRNKLLYKKYRSKKWFKKLQ